MSNKILIQLTLLGPMEFSITFDTVLVRMAYYIYIEGSQVKIFKAKLYFFL